MQFLAYNWLTKSNSVFLFLSLPHWMISCTFITNPVFYLLNFFSTLKVFVAKELDIEGSCFSYVCVSKWYEFRFKALTKKIFSIINCMVYLNIFLIFLGLFVSSLTFILIMILLRSGYSLSTTLKLYLWMCVCVCVDIY